MISSFIYLSEIDSFIFFKYIIKASNHVYILPYNSTTWIRGADMPIALVDFASVFTNDYIIVLGIFLILFLFMFYFLFSFNILIQIF